MTRQTAPTRQPAPTRGAADPRWLPPALAVIFAVALLLRLLGRVDYVEEIDAFRFIEGVESFDPAALRPHFPGYIVFIAAGKAAAALLGDAQTGLTALVALCGALLVLPVALLARRLGGPVAAVTAAMLVAVNPLLWLNSDKVLSDIPGLLLATTALAWLTSRLVPAPEGRPNASQLAHVGGAMALLGLALGARLSLFPLALSALAWLIWRKAAWRVGGAGLVLGVLLWLLPTLMVAGVERFLSAGQVAIGGHFFRWGGSAVTVSDPVARLQGLVWAVAAHGFGAWWHDRTLWLLLPTAALTLLAGVILAQAARLGRAALMPWLLIAGPYLLWLMLGQNVTARPRHALPLVVFGIVALAVGHARMWSHSAPLRPLATAAMAVLLVGNFALGWQLSARHQQAPPPKSLALEVQRRCLAALPTPTVVYTASMDRHLRRHAPCAQVVVERRLARARRHRARLAGPTQAFVTSDLSRLDRLRSPALARFRRDRYVHNSRHEVALYRLGRAR